MDGHIQRSPKETSSPTGWVERSFYELARITSGQVDPRVEPYRSMTLVAPDHIRSGAGRIDQRLTAAQQRAISGKYLVRQGEVIYSKIRPNLQKLALANEDCLCSADMYPVAAKGGVSSRFLKYLMLSAPFTEFATSVSVRSGMPKINRQELAHFSALVPESLKEQQAIAEALSDADGLIEGLERLIAKKRLIKQGAMQDLLTAKRRLPGFSGEWRTVSFTSAFRRINAKDRQVLASDYAENGDIPVVDQGKQKIAGYTNRKDKCFSPPEDGVIVFGDHTRIVKFIEFEFAIGADGTQLIGSKEGFDARFLAYALGEKDIPNTGYNRHFKFLKEMSFNVPPEKEEQETIASALSDMDTEIQALETRLVKARQVKEGMMQNLLTGRIRLV